ncbi:hypothetical protein MNBD_DELTA01-888 [hydrothermal vent metagenome]|uniref:Regulatory protein RecX n=1 Tax=hydrothermal vent metagenome TaxID=652676 RepID=A0A3B0QRE5_9ZZZZ
MKQSTNEELKEDSSEAGKSAALPDAKDMATSLISYKEWTKSALTQRLLKRGCIQADIDVAMVWLEEQGLIDDRKYAFEFASSRMRTRLWGIIKISAELKKRGIDATLAQEATTSLKGETEEAAALAALQKWLRIKRFTPPLSSAVAFKASSHLRSKGFTGQAIGFAMNNNNNECPEEYPVVYEDQ